MTPWPWRWTPAEWRTFFDWWLGVVINRTTFKVIIGIVVGVTIVTTVLAGGGGDVSCDTAVYWCLQK